MTLDACPSVERVSVASHVGGGLVIHNLNGRELVTQVEGVTRHTRFGSPDLALRFWDCGVIEGGRYGR